MSFENRTFMRSSKVLVHEQAIINNWNAIVAKIPPQTRILPMVKANAYGHDDGLFTEIVTTLGAVGVGVADLGEAVALREKKYTGPILCFGPITEETLPYANKLDLILSLHDSEELNILRKHVPLDGNQIRLHIKVDTGMHRWGIPAEDATSIAQTLQGLGHLSVEGVYTHFAESGVIDSDFTREQIAVFSAAFPIFEKTLGRRLIRHAANSGAIFNYPDSHFDWVRPGLALYGYASSPGAPESKLLSPALEWRAKICQIKKIASGNTVGYNRAFRATSPHRIGTVGVGYGDGYLRNYADVGVFYEGQKRNVLGIISMDALAVDLTSTPSAKVGDEVVLLGSHSNAPNAWDLARAARTIPYEALTSIQNRVPRVVCP